MIRGRRAQISLAVLVAGVVLIGLWRGGYAPWNASSSVTPYTVSLPGHVGGDFALISWFPGRALLSGHEAYASPATYENLPAGVAQRPLDYVERRYHASVSPSFYPPVVLLMTVLLILLPLRDAYTVLELFTAAALWLAICSARWTRTLTESVVILVLGLLAFYGYEMTSGVTFGQPVGLAIAGMALIVWGYARGPDSRHRDLLLGTGALLCCSKFQFGIPALVMLVALRFYRPALCAFGLAILGSAPFLILEIHAAGGLSAAIHAIRHNLSFLNGLNSATGYAHGRSDLASTISRSPHTSLQVIVFVAATAVLVAVIARGRRRESLGPIAVACLLTSYSLLCIDHLSYDEAVLYVPAAWAVLRSPRPSVRLVAAAYFVYEVLVWRSQSSGGLPGESAIPWVRHLFGGPVSAELIPLAVFAAGVARVWWGDAGRGWGAEPVGGRSVRPVSRPFINVGN